MWFKVDDAFPFNPKVVACPLEALGLWVSAGAWCAQQLTDGYVPRSVLPMLRGSEAIASSLVQAGLWFCFDDGYKFHDWDEYQPSSLTARERRKQTSAKRAEAGRKGGVKSGLTRRNKTEKARSKREAIASDLLEANSKQAAKQNEAPSRPVPSIDNPLTSFGGAGGGDSDEPHLPDVVADAPTTPAEAKPKRKTTGTRLPDGWFPSRTDANESTEAGHDQAWLQRELDRFRDHWAAQPGQRGRKADWDATWRNWVRKADEMAPRTRQSETDAWYARAKARASNPNPLLSLLADDARPSDDPGRHAMPPRSA